MSESHSDSERARWSRAGLVAALVTGLALTFALGRCSVGSDAKPTSAAGGDDHDGEATVWSCSMDPQVRSLEPGKCPICGMDLVPLDGGEDTSSARITLSERARVLAKIVTAEVRVGHAGQQEGRLLGRLDYDETRMRTVTAWTSGRIDRLRVATTGADIKRGQVVATLYSPELYTAQSDLILAHRQRDRLTASSPTARRAGEAALAAAEQRLRLLGVPGAEIETMATAARPARQVKVRSQFAGTVIRLLVDEGSYVAAGAGLYRVADLSRLWVQLDAHESDLPQLRVGQEVALTITAMPGHAFAGTVKFIDPVLNPRTLTARVRVEVANPDGALRPGMFAEAVVSGEVEGEGGERLLIPATAPLFTGRRALVYVEVPASEALTYEAREVTLGARVGDFYPVIAGLAAGERVVVRGAFVIDADLQIRGGDSMMSRADDRDRGDADRVSDLPEAARAALGRVVSAYLEIQEGLASDDLARASAAALALIAAVGGAGAAMPARARASWAKLAVELERHAELLSGASDISVARHGFEGLSKQLKALLTLFGNPGELQLAVAFCPMAFDYRGAEWVQAAAELRNSYFGAEMLSCGEFRQRIAPGAFLEGARTTAPAPPMQGHQH